MISEKEIIARIYSKHAPESVQKYIEEILWRTYWKGWLEFHPSLWDFYLDESTRQKKLVDHQKLKKAEMGQVGIEGFDDWAKELIETGYLHNHARMWFASIWIFTLQLPWILGADFFLRHLIDADIASNTLSWRWVAGLHTQGKTYLATADNISRYTGGRFKPKGLANKASQIEDRWSGGQRMLVNTPHSDHAIPSILLIHHDDLDPEVNIFKIHNIVQVIIVCDRNLLFGEKAYRFVTGAIDDLKERIVDRYTNSVILVDELDEKNLLDAIQITGAKKIITSYAPVGPIATKLISIKDRLAEYSIDLVQLQRNWDSRFWPYAQKSYFKFKEKVLPLLLEDEILNESKS
jgi:deoxyribodipyrimidine photo-lyase